MKTKDKYTLKEICPNIFLLSFKTQYKLGMHFCRAQEFYESPKFKNKPFTMFDLMEWYSESKEEGEDQCFSYPADWVGFNVPGKVMLGLYEFNQDGYKNIPDWNRYDEAMGDILLSITGKTKGKDWYLIGALSSDKDVIAHELAHAFWSTDKVFKKNMRKLIKDIPEKQSKSFKKYLKTMYTPSVIEDEMQAYLSTGLTDYMELHFKKENMGMKRIQGKFEKYFNNYILQFGIDFMSKQ